MARTPTAERRRDEWDKARRPGTASPGRRGVSRSPPAYGVGAVDRHAAAARVADRTSRFRDPMFRRPGLIDEWEVRLTSLKGIAGEAVFKVACYRPNPTPVTLTVSGADAKLQLFELKAKLGKKFGERTAAGINAALGTASWTFEREVIPGLRPYIGAKLVEGSFDFAGALAKLTPASLRLGLKGDISDWPGLDASDVRCVVKVELKVDAAEAARLIRYARKSREASTVARKIKKADQALKRFAREGDEILAAMKDLGNVAEPANMKAMDKLLERSRRLSARRRAMIERRVALRRRLSSVLKRVDELGKRLETPLAKRLAGSISRAAAKRISAVLAAVGIAMTVLDLADLAVKLSGHWKWGLDDTPFGTRGTGPEGGEEVAAGTGGGGTIPGTGQRTPAAELARRAGDEGAGAQGSAQGQQLPTDYRPLDGPRDLERKVRRLLNHKRARFDGADGWVSVRMVRREGPKLILRVVQVGGVVRFVHEDGTVSVARKGMPISLGLPAEFRRRARRR